MATNDKTARNDPPTEKQIAALPIRWDGARRLRVLMVTSRGTGRWVMPKGWTMDGKKPWQAAGIEALEEAGALGAIGSEPLGTYRYRKILEDGTGVPVRVTLYPMIVDRLRKDWKERRERRRKWFSVRGAARRVEERELRDMLLSLEKRPRKIAAIRAALKVS